MAGPWSAGPSASWCLRSQKEMFIFRSFMTSLMSSFTWCCSVSTLSSFIHFSFFFFPLTYSSLFFTVASSYFLSSLEVFLPHTQTKHPLTLFWQGQGRISNITRGNSLFLPFDFDIAGNWLNDKERKRSKGNESKCNKRFSWMMFNLSWRW